MRLTSNLDTIALVAGLLLSCSVPMILQPPEKLMELDMFSWQRQCYFAGIMLGIVLHFTSIMISLLFLNGLNTSAFPSHRLALLLHLDMTPTISYVLFILGCYALSAGIAAGIEPLYGYGAAWSFLLVVGFVCGVVPNMWNSTSVMSRAHVVHAYYKADPKAARAAAEMRLQAFLLSNRAAGRQLRADVDAGAAEDRAAAKASATLSTLSSAFSSTSRSSMASSVSHEGNGDGEGYAAQQPHPTAHNHGYAMSHHQHHQGGMPHLAVAASMLR